MEKHTLKIMLKCGQVIQVFADESNVVELISHPKFLRMSDTGNDVYVSIEDVSAFEIMDNRNEANEPETTPSTEQ